MKRVLVGLSAACVFAVYSVGPTGHFDGGKPGQKVPGQESLFRHPAVPLPPI